MSAYRDRLLTVGVISRRDRPTITEGRQHPGTGRPWKRTEDEAQIITEHNTRDDRVDATAKVATVHAHLGDLQARKAKTDGQV